VDGQDSYLCEASHFQVKVMSMSDGLVVNIQQFDLECGD
jgi:hypothetical protein